jgi:hypothetical protein
MRLASSAVSHFDYFWFFFVFFCCGLFLRIVFFPYQYTKNIKKNMWVSEKIQPCSLGCGLQDRIRVVLEGVSKSRVSKILVMLKPDRLFGVDTVLWKKVFEEQEDGDEADNFTMNIPYVDILPHPPDSTLEVWAMYRPKPELPPLSYLPSVLEKIAYSYLDVKERLWIREVHG